MLSLPSDTSPKPFAEVFTSGKKRRRSTNPANLPDAAIPLTPFHLYSQYIFFFYHRQSNAMFVSCPIRNIGGASRQLPLPLPLSLSLPLPTPKRHAIRTYPNKPTPTERFAKYVPDPHLASLPLTIY